MLEKSWPVLRFLSILALLLFLRILEKNSGRIALLSGKRTPMTSAQQLKNMLKKLKEEHRLLDETILCLVETSPHDQLAVQRLKKKKLYLKDKILTLEMKIIPDIIA